MKPTSLLPASARRSEPPIGRPTSNERPAASLRLSPAAVWTLIRRWVVVNTFVPTWWPRERHPRVGAHLLALVLQVFAAAATLLVASVFPTFSFAEALSILAVTLAAFTWGAAPSLVATLLGVILLEVMVLPSMNHGPVSHAGDAVEIVVYLSVGGIVSIVASQTERARRRAVRESAAAHARELALQEINERTDEFLSIASHELRSPLTSLKMALQLSERRLNPLLEPGEHEEIHAGPQRCVEAVVDLLHTAEQQVHRQERLVGDLLDVSRIRADRLEIRMAPCDLAAVVRDAVEEQRLAWPGRAIETGLAVETLPVEADAHRLGQVVTNFLTNALKYSAPDALVQVTLRRTPAGARVAVCDHGPGLSPEQIVHIWERFHRVPGIKQQSGSGAGLGLGLYICRTIVERHGGQVGLESKPGRGSTFWFAVPA